MQVAPSWQVMEQFVLNELHIVFGLDSLQSSHPISIPVGHPDEISQIFDRISYAKGKSGCHLDLGWLIMQHILMLNLC